jgi:hypothetical protein
MSETSNIDSTYAPTSRILSRHHIDGLVVDRFVTRFDPAPVWIVTDPELVSRDDHGGVFLAAEAAGVIEWLRERRARAEETFGTSTLRRLGR